MRLERLRSQGSTELSPGDLYSVQIGGDDPCVLLVLGHTRRTRAGRGHMFVWLYHWAGVGLRAHPHDLRDEDPNSVTAETMLERREDQPRFLGNLFSLLPLASLLEEEP